MVVSCSKCQTRYSVPEDKIKPSGSNFRCKKCQNSFVVFPPQTAAPETNISPPLQKQATPPPPPLPPQVAPKKQYVKDGQDIFVKRGLIEVTASADDEIPVFDSSESAPPSKKLSSNHISSKFKKEISAAFQAFERKKDLVISKIKHLTGAYKVPNETQEKRSFKAWYATGAFFLIAALTFAYVRRGEEAPKAKSKVAKIVTTEISRDPEWLNTDLKFLNQYLEKTAAIKSADSNAEEQRFYKAEAMISVGLFNNDSKLLTRGLLESNLAAAQYENSAYRWSPLLAFALWSDDFTLIRKIVENSQEASATTEHQLARMIIQIRKNPRDPSGYKTLAKLIDDKPSFALAQWWALSLSVDQPEATESAFSSEKKEAWILKFKAQKNELKNGLPPLFENLERKIASHPSPSATSASATTKIAK